MSATIVTTRSARRTSLSSRLLVLFFAGFLAIVAGGLIWELFSGMADNRRNELEVTVQQNAVVIDPNLEKDLAKVLNFESGQNLADLRDPFVDRAGLSQTGNAINRAVVRSSTSSSVPAATASQSSPRTVISSVPSNPSRQTIQGSQTGSSVSPKVIEKEDTMVRILKRDERIRAGIPVGPENEVFAIEDLLPVGVVSGGSGQDEILLYSQTADRTYSFPVGTRFFDGWLSGIRAEGAVFSFHGTNVTALKSWSRSIQPRSGQNLSPASPNQTSPAGGN